MRWLNKMYLMLAALLVAFMLPVTLLAQELPDPTSTDPLEMLLGLLFPVGIALATRYGFEGLQILLEFISVKFPAGLKPFLAVAIGFGLGQAALLLGVPLPGALEDFTVNTVASIAGAIATVGWHRIKAKESNL